MECFTDWIEGLEKDEREELLTEWISDFAVSGEIQKSGNYFIVPLTGKHTGYVYEFEHDGFEFIKRGENFADFIEMLSTVNAELIDDICSHNRYQDSRPDSQWLVKEYEFE